MKFAVLGSGLQGRAVAYDLCQNPSVTEVALVDQEIESLDTVVLSLRALLTRDVLKPVQLDVTHQAALIEFLKPYDVVVSAVPYFLNLAITDAAIASQTHMVDMGGNTDLVFAQRERDQAAREAGVTILPDCGLAPGMANILAAHGIKQLNQVDAVHIRVGGLPQKPEPPLNYQLFFSIHGLINEYMGRSIVLKNGKRETVPTLTDVETLHFREPVGTCEAFHTLGGLSTLPWTYEGQIQTMDYKTVRYPGHCAQIKLFADLGFMDETPVFLQGKTLTAREAFAALITPKLLKDDPRDIVVVRVLVRGEKAKETVEVSYEIMDTYDAATGFTAMMRTTAFPVAIVAQMMGDGRIKDRGVLALETTVPAEAFIEELTARGIRLQADTVPRREAHAHC